MQNSYAVDEQSLIDRRGYPRFRVNYLTEVYMGSEILFATVVDLSERGLGIMLPGRFYLGEAISLRVKSSLYDDVNTTEEEVNISMAARIIWIRKEGHMYKAGLAITCIDSADLLKMKRNIRFMQSKAGY